MDPTRVTLCGCSQMTDGEKSFKDKLEFQIALRKIDSAFEACSRFEGADKKTLFEAIGETWGLSGILCLRPY